MADSSPPTSPKRSHLKPATWVGGQRHRRRLARRTGSASSSTPILPRSTTAPVLYRGVGGSAMSSLGISSAFTGYRPASTTSSEHSGPAAPSPTPTASTEHAKASAEGRKKRHILGVLKRQRPESVHAETPEPIEPTPIPPLTPKAARMLGLEFHGPVDGEVSHKDRRQPDSDDEYEMPRPPMRRQSSMPWLPSRNSSQTSLQTRFKEEEMGETDPPAPASTNHLTKINWKASNKKAMRMLDLNWNRPRSSQPNMDLDSSSLASREDLDAEISYTSDSDVLADRPLPPRPIPAHKIHAQKRKSRTKKKGPKSLERMSPITEASLSEDGVVIQGDGEGTILEAISEDERPRTLSDLEEFPKYNDDPFHIEETEHDSLAYLGEELPNPSLLHQNTTKLQRIEHPEVVHVKSPLQEIERVFLNNQELRMSMNFENEQLAKAHKKMKRDLRDLKTRSIIQDETNYDFESLLGRYELDESKHDSSDQDTDGGIGSDIDMDLPVSLETPKMRIYKRITPGMVKLVNIPPVRSKLGVSQPRNSSGEIKASSPHRRDGFVDVEELMLNASLGKASDENLFTKKKRFPKEASREKVAGWVADYNNTEQRPLSERIDADVLAEQQIPPAPLPKDLRLPLSLQAGILSSKGVGNEKERARPALQDRQAGSALDTPLVAASPNSATSISASYPQPRKASSPKHHCIHNGHVFHAIPLNRIPDEISINTLEVRPYLQTPTGVKQHVDVPIYCEMCKFSVRGEMWECDIPACRLTVCKYCAQNMEMEWQQRAVDGWKK